MLYMRSEPHNDMMKGVNVCSLVFLWYMTEAMIKKLKVNPQSANNVATNPPTFATACPYKNGVVSLNLEVSFHQHWLLDGFDTNLVTKLVYSKRKELAEKASDYPVPIGKIDLCKYEFSIESVYINIYIPYSTIKVNIFPFLPCK